ncbi:uncharacterized protein BKCO1_37000113 [Diplodia corticola]|uniref:Rhodopsin domain-containing protein n=1 Tax=Diplodia corticola TaxID=236234 RepID=A0A1J9RIZ6_9PEZI|nr:uncharacterized protein BKCO1_37000113 [Diplodia corticola]OJD32531.1 hypothetical protein BKCO1_37000113 [Diplodia corticola]
MLYDASKAIVTCVFTLVAPAFVSFTLRCGVRISRKAWGVDDTCMALAVPFFAWLSATCLSGAWHGIGATDDHLYGGTEQYSAALKARWRDWFMFMVAYCSSVLLVKLSIALTLLRIASGRRVYAWIIRATIALFTVVTVIVLIYAWDKSIPDGKCKDARILTAMSFALSATNILTDWTCALLPIPLLWNLEMNRNSKIAAGCLLSFGVFASACAIIRLQYTVGLSATEDYLFHISSVMLWAYAEVGVGMTAANCSTLRPVFKRILKLGSSFGRSAGDDTTSLSSSDYGCCSKSRSRREGAIELDDSCDASPYRVKPAVNGGRDARTTDEDINREDNDNESAREILRESRQVNSTYKNRFYT